MQQNASQVLNHVFNVLKHASNVFNRVSNALNNANNMEGIEKGPQAGIQIWDSRNAMPLYVGRLGTLPTRLINASNMLKDGKSCYQLVKSW